MANQRKKGKTNQSLWVTDDEKLVIESLMGALGMSKTDVIKTAIQELAKKELNKGSAK